MIYDICYIGGGLNYAGAVVATNSGLKVALIEENMDEIGGVCLHKGCIPSKMFLHYAQTKWESSNKPFKGKISLDMKDLVFRKNKLIKASAESIKKQCSKVDLIEGSAKITKPFAVEIVSNGKRRVLKAKNIVIGTGSKAFIPESIKYDGDAVITSKEALDMQELPKSIAIYGNGAIGLEMASFFASNGCETTLVYRGDKILKNAHPLIASAMEKQLKNIGINLMPKKVIKEAKKDKKEVSVTFNTGETMRFQKLLVATGRVPRVDSVDCSDIDVTKKGIVTNNEFETTLKNHYAIGDCNGKIKLAHAARAEVLFVTKKILGKNERNIILNNIVKFIHTTPMSYAWVGKTKSSLGDGCKEGKGLLNSYPHSVVFDAQDGAMIVYADDNDFIVGGEILSPYAEELIAVVSMAIAGEMDIKLAKRTILAHPTFSETLERAFHKIK